MTTAAPDFLEELRTNTKLYASLLKIVDKDENTVPLVPNAAQIAFEEILEAQRAEGKPQRAIVLKARQVGISTWTQAKLVQRATLRQNHRAVVVAHDGDTAGKLFEMGKKMYANLPADGFVDVPDPDGVPLSRPLKPEIRRSRSEKHLHFAESERDAWQKGGLWPDSHYTAETANEFQGGRGSTFHSGHLSELAFYQNPSEKLTALKNAIPRRPGTLIVIESTANGQNFFKDQWDLAVAGESGYAPFFWPWWKHEEYRMPFISQAERERFVVGEGRWGADEPDLIRRFDLDLEQLNWRRATIADECSGSVPMFKQEYPADPREAFLGTGDRVFDGDQVAELREFIVLNFDAPSGDPGPLKGKLRGTGEREVISRTGTITVPAKALWTPQTDLELGEAAPWKFWLETDDDGKPVPPKRPPVIGVDVSGGEIEGEGSEPAKHAIEIIDLMTGDQLAEYSSRVDPALLAAELWLAILFFGFDPDRMVGPMCAVERTGGWGMPVVRTLWFDYHYPFVYRSRPAGRTQEKQEHRLGWETSPKTKPLLLSHAQELLRAKATGIRSDELASEMESYIRDEKGKTMPEPGKFSDRFMAWAIAQFARKEQPILPEDELGDEDV